VYETGQEALRLFSRSYDFIDREPAEELVWFVMFMRRALDIVPGTLNDAVLHFDEGRALAGLAALGPAVPTELVVDRGTGPDAVESTASIVLASGVLLRDFEWNITKIFATRSARPTRISEHVAFVPSSRGVVVIAMSATMQEVARAAMDAISFRQLVEVVGSLPSLESERDLDRKVQKAVRLLTLNGVLSHLVVTNSAEH
ncbi:hypothetical protein, partial [Nocardia sp. NPDC060259]|uniref:hypothetical protein n=1 Tax=Nocardia sp. NPDC060259 TaxID=3347088 RepID=UPI003651D979